MSYKDLLSFLMLDLNFQNKLQVLVAIVMKISPRSHFISIPCKDHSGHIPKPIFHQKANPFASGSSICLDPQHNDFVLPIPTGWNLKSLAYPTPTLKFMLLSLFGIPQAHCLQFALLSQQAVYKGSGMISAFLNKLSKHSGGLTLKQHNSLLFLLNLIMLILSISTYLECTGGLELWNL